MRFVQLSCILSNLSGLKQVGCTQAQAACAQVLVLEVRREAHLFNCLCRGRVPLTGPPAEPRQGPPAPGHMVPGPAAPGAPAELAGAGSGLPGSGQASGDELLALVKCSSGLDPSVGQRFRILAPWHTAPVPGFGLGLGPAGTGPGPPMVLALHVEPV